MSYKRKNFGILGGEAKGGASIRLYSYLLDKEETFNDLLATGYFNEERERLLPNDLIKVLMPDKDFKLGYLMVKRVTLDNVEVIKVEIDAKSDLLPLPDSDTGSSGNSDLVSRHDHQHPKVIATETIRGQIIIASEEETLQGTNNTKTITPLKNKLYFNNQQATSEEINNGADVKKYLNPLQVKTIKDELQQNINNNTTLINNNKANISLNNINAEGQNVIKGIISNNAVLKDGSNADFSNLSATAKDNIRRRATPDYSAIIIISSRESFTVPAYGVIIGLIGPGNVDPTHNVQAIGLYANPERTVRLAGISIDLTNDAQYSNFCVPVEKNKTYYLDGENGVCMFFPYY